MSEDGVTQRQLRACDRSMIARERENSSGEVGAAQPLRERLDSSGSACSTPAPPLQYTHAHSHHLPPHHWHLTIFIITLRWAVTPAASPLPRSPPAPHPATMASTSSSRDALFSSPFQALSSSAASNADLAFPRCSIQLLHGHDPYHFSYYAAPPHLTTSSPLFSHLLSTFLRSIHSLLSIQPAAFEGTDGLLYPPTVMLQLPSMMEGRSFKVLPEPSPSPFTTLSPSSSSPSTSWSHSKASKKKTVSFGQAADMGPALPAVFSSFTAARRSFPHPPAPIATAFPHSFPPPQLSSPGSPSPLPPQSPVASPLPPSLLAPSSFPLPSYTTSIPLLRSLLSHAFLPVPDAALSTLFTTYTPPPPSPPLLPRSSFHALLSTCLTSAASSHPHLPTLRLFFAHFFTFLDTHARDAIDQPTFHTGMALLLSSQRGDRLGTAFRLIDRAGLGYITPTSLFTASIAFVPTLLSLGHPLSATPHVAYRSSFDPPSLAASVYEIAGKVVREAFGCGDLNVDGHLSEEEFRALHLVRPSCLPWVNVLVDPEKVGEGGGGVWEGRGRVEDGGGGVGSGAGVWGRGVHGRSASLPQRVDFRPELDEDEYKTFPGASHRGRERKDEEEEEEEAEAEAAEMNGQRQQQQLGAPDDIDEVMQRKMQELTMNLSQSGRYPTSGRAVQPRQFTPAQNGASAQQAEQAEEEDDDEEQTEQFLASMWQEMRRLTAGQDKEARGRRKRWSNDAVAVPDDKEDDADGEVAMVAASIPPSDQQTQQPLSATVEVPRLSSLCSTSSFLSIHPHIAPFQSLKLENLLELFQLLMQRNDRLTRAELPRVISTLAIGQSSHAHEVMTSTVQRLFTWFDTDEDDEVESLELVLALSAICAEDSREQLHVGFALCDGDADGRMTVEEVERYLIDMMGAFFALTEQWNTLVRLTKQEQEEKANRKRALAQKKAEAESKVAAAAAASSTPSTDAGQSSTAPSPTSTDATSRDASTSSASASAPAVSPTDSGRSASPDLLVGDAAARGGVAADERRDDGGESLLCGVWERGGGAGGDGGRGDAVGVDGSSEAGRGRWRRRAGDVPNV